MWHAIPTIYIALVTGVWGFIEAYSYFQGDGLKNAIGPNWVFIYLLPLPIAFVIGIVREKKRHQGNNKFISEVFQKGQSKPNASRGNYIKYKGLIWKPTWFGLRLPVPLCPRENCERPVYHERDYPPRYLISANLQEMQEFLIKQNTYKNVYRCPVHGVLHEVLDIELGELKREARFELKR